MNSSVLFFVLLDAGEGDGKLFSVCYCGQFVLRMVF